MYHGIIERFGLGWKRPWRSASSNPPAVGRELPLDQVAQSLIQPVLECFFEYLELVRRICQYKGFFTSFSIFLRFSLTFLCFFFLSLLPCKFFFVYYLSKKVLILEQINTAMGEGSCFISRCEGNFKIRFEIKIRCPEDSSVWINICCLPATSAAVRAMAEQHKPSCIAAQVLRAHTVLAAFAGMLPNKWRAIFSSKSRKRIESLYAVFVKISESVD